MSPTPPRPELPDLAASVQQEVARLAASPEVRSAFNWFRTQEPQLAHWQMEMARIPAPPFGESARAAWLAERFREIGLDDVRIDDVGNVFGAHPGFGRRYVALSAHIDTVFPANTPLNIRQQGSRIYGPGVSDNGAGVAALLGIAALLRTVRIRHALPFVFIGNVGEEGEGDLRGMRHIFTTPRWKDSIAYSLVLDGAGSDTIVAEALGSRRFEVIVRGPGGHSWSDFGAPNPIVILAKAIETFTATPVPTHAQDDFQHRSDSRRNLGEFDSRVSQHEGGYPFDLDDGDGAIGAVAPPLVEPRCRRRNRGRRDAIFRTEAAGRRELRSAGDRKPAGGRVAGGSADFAGCAGGGCATDERGAGAAGLDRCERPAIPGAGSGCHRWWRVGRRGTHFAGVV